MNPNTIDTEPINVIITKVHHGRGQHRASRKIQVEDQLKTKSENRRRQRTAKDVKIGRYRADTHKVNLTWFIGFILVAVAAFSGCYGLLIGMMTPEPVVMMQTHERTVNRDYLYPTIPDTCIDALDSADKGFEIAESVPKVKLEKIGKHLEVSHKVPKTVKFYEAMQRKVYAQDEKYNTQKVACLNSDNDATLMSESVIEDTK